MGRTQRGRATLAPSVHVRIGSGQLGVLLTVLGSVVFASACSLLTSSQQTGPASASPAELPSSSPGGEPSSTSCQPAPDWLLAALTNGLAARGATLSEVFVGEASITSGPPRVMAPSFGPARWIVGKVNGAGVRPGVAIWVTNGTASGKKGEILGANAAALRLSTFGVAGQAEIHGDGQGELLACLSPIPES